MKLDGLVKSVTTYGDLGNFTSRVSLAVEPIAEGNATLQKLLSHTTSELTVLRAVLNSSRKDDFTRVKFDLDAVRDTREQGFSHQVESWTYRDTQPEQRQAARELFEILDNIGPTHYEGYKKQTELTQRIRTEMDKPENQEKLELLGITDWYAEWVEADDAFQAAVDESNDAERQALPQLIKAYNTLSDCVENLLNYVQAMVSVEPEVYMDVAVKIKNISDEINAAARARETRKKNGESEDEQQAQTQQVDSGVQDTTEE